MVKLQCFVCQDSPSLTEEQSRGWIGKEELEGGGERLELGGDEEEGRRRVGKEEKEGRKVMR